MSVIRQEICRSKAAHQISQGYFGRNMANQQIARTLLYKRSFLIVFFKLAENVFDQSASSDKPWRLCLLRQFQQ
jgi:hypothetical protein